MNFWITALFKKWATTSQVRIAYRYNDCSKEDLQDGVAAQMVTHDEYQEVTDEPYTEAAE